MIDLTLVYATFGAGLLAALIAAILVMRHKTLPPNAQLHDFQIKESSYVGRTLLGLVIFLSFAVWTAMLITKGTQLIPEKVLGWALFSGLCALIGLFLTTFFWRQKNLGRHAVVQKTTTNLADVGATHQREEVTGNSASLQENDEVKEPAVETSIQSNAASTATVATAAAAAGLAVASSNAKAETGIGSQSSSANLTEQAAPNATSIPKHSHLDAGELSRMPQDSVLRRHYMTKLRYEIEASLPPRPTDSVLKRHYETLLNTEMEKRLS